MPPLILRRPALANPKKAGQQADTVFHIHQQHNNYRV